MKTTFSSCFVSSLCGSGMQFRSIVRDISTPSGRIPKILRRLINRTGDKNTSQVAIDLTFNKQCFAKPSLPTS